MIARCRLAAALAILLCAAPAWAHGTVPGARGLVAAFVHTITEGPAPLALTGLGILIGASGTRALECAWLGFFTAMVIGIGTTVSWGVAIDPEKPLLLVAAATGLLAACDVKLTRTYAAAIAAPAGYLLGVFAAPAPASWSTTMYMSSGALLGANLLFAYSAIIVSAIRRRWSQNWVQIAFRILGSWVGAISVLLLALSMRR